MKVLKQFSHRNVEKTKKIKRKILSEIFDPTNVPAQMDDSNDETCKLTMYDGTYFRGKSEELVGDEVEIVDFNEMNFDDSLGSLKIEGNCCWHFFTEPYAGVIIPNILLLLHKSNTSNMMRSFKYIFKFLL